MGAAERCIKCDSIVNCKKNLSLVSGAFASHALIFSSFVRLDAQIVTAHRDKFNAEWWLTAKAETYLLKEIDLRNKATFTALFREQNQLQDASAKLWRDECGKRDSAETKRLYPKKNVIKWVH